MSLNVCFVERDEGGRVVDREELPGFVQASSTTEESLVNTFLETLGCRIQLNKMIGEGYHRAVNMKGKVHREDSLSFEWQMCGKNLSWTFVEYNFILSSR